MLSSLPHLHPMPVADKNPPDWFDCFHKSPGKLIGAFPNDILRDFAWVKTERNWKQSMNYSKNKPVISAASNVSRMFSVIWSSSSLPRNLHLEKCFSRKILQFSVCALRGGFFFGSYLLFVFERAWKLLNFKVFTETAGRKSCSWTSKWVVGDNEIAVTLHTFYILVANTRHAWNTEKAPVSIVMFYSSQHVAAGASFTPTKKKRLWVKVVAGSLHFLSVVIHRRRFTMGGGEGEGLQALSFRCE